MNLLRNSDLIVITAGEYDDYRILAICKIKEDVISDETIRAAMERYIKIHHPKGTPQEEKKEFSARGFVKWMIIEEGIFESLEYVEFNFHTTSTRYRPEFDFTKYAADDL